MVQNSQCRSIQFHTHRCSLEEGNVPGYLESRSEPIPAFLFFPCCSFPWYLDAVIGDFLLLLIFLDYPGLMPGPPCRATLPCTQGAFHSCTLVEMPWILMDVPRVAVAPRGVCLSLLRPSFSQLVSVSGCLIPTLTF